MLTRNSSTSPLVFGGPDLLGALERMGIRVPDRQMLPAEKAAHEAAFMVDPPEDVHPRFDDGDTAADYHYRNEVA